MLMTVVVEARSVKLVPAVGVAATEDTERGLPMPMRVTLFTCGGSGSPLQLAEDAAIGENMQW